MSAFNDALKAVEPYRPPCQVKLLRDSLKGSDLVDFDTALADPSVPGEMISKALATLGKRVQGQTIQRHRRGRCRCGQAS